MIPIFLVSIARIDILRKRGNLATILAHIVKALAKPNHTVGKLLAKLMRLAKIGAEASVTAVMPIGENLSIVACALLIGERILLDLGNLELGFHPS